MFALGLTVFVSAVIGIGVVALIVYVIVNRIRQKDEERFLDRDN
jgi:protein-S-isoprenylcysteine O-methyltransferase Ste14